MIQDDPPTTITGLLTGEDTKPLNHRFARALLLCAFLAAPMLTLLLTIGAYQLDQHYRVVHSFQVQTQFVEQGGVLIVGTFDKHRHCEFVSVTGRSSDGDVAGVTFMDRRPNEPMFSRPLGQQKFGPWYVEGNAGEGITLHAVHRCHFLWPHYEEIGTFVVGQQ
jgi:hypothetical protein